MAEQPFHFSFSLYARSKQKLRELPGSCSKSHRRRSPGPRNSQRRPHSLASQPTHHHTPPRPNPQTQTRTNRTSLRPRTKTYKNKRLRNISKKYRLAKTTNYSRHKKFHQPRKFCHHNKRPIIQLQNFPPSNSPSRYNHHPRRSKNHPHAKNAGKPPQRLRMN